jgi:hypothetical protein
MFQRAAQLVAVLCVAFLAAAPAQAEARRRAPVP